MQNEHGTDPPNRFAPFHRETDPEFLEWDQEHLHEFADRKIEYLSDSSKSVVSENQSPDVPFRYSLNPYRGCIHACSYCYARPTHEYLGFSAGTDFETKIIVKHDAPRLLREFLAKDSWKVEPIVFSGVTDCYQPAERQFQLTGQCLAVAHECRLPIGIITKNALVVRDIDLLQSMAKHDLVRVFVSVTTLEPKLARSMEPRTSIPAARLRAIRELADAGIPVGVMVAPVIPGLNDAEIPAILEAAKSAGAITAGYVLLRLPLTVEPVFRNWLRNSYPLKAELILGRVRQTRDGKLNQSAWGKRMAGNGPIAGQIHSMFRLFQKKHGLDNQLPTQNCELFQPPLPRSGQLRLF